MSITIIRSVPKSVLTTTFRFEAAMSAIEQFVPLPNQEPIFTTEAREILVTGGVRAGATTCGAIKTAAVILDKTVMGIPQRPPWKSDPLNVLCVSSVPAELHKRNFERTMFRPGLFMVDGEKSEPLIDEDRIVRNIQSEIVIDNGCTIRFIHLTQDSETVPATDSMDFIWIEHCPRLRLYNELISRILDRRGAILWTDKPYDTESDMYQVAVRARQDPSNVCRVTLRLTDNSHLPPDEVKAYLRHWTGD